MKQSSKFNTAGSVTFGIFRMLLLFTMVYFSYNWGYHEGANSVSALSVERQADGSRTRLGAVKMKDEIYKADDMDFLLNLKADVGSVYETNVVDELLAGKADKDPEVPVPEDAEDRGVTFVDSDGIDQNVSVVIGKGASAGVEESSVESAPSNTVLRSGSVAIGGGAIAYDPSQPYKQQATAIGWNAQATAINAVAVGSGAQHTNETAMTGNATVASGAKAISVGYDAKATNADSVSIGASAKSLADGAVQLGQGVNTNANSLQFRNVTIVKDGKLAVPGVDSNAVQKIVQAESDKGIMYGSMGRTNEYSYIRMVGYNATEDSDPEFILAINSDTNSEYAASFPLYPGSPNRRDLYSAQTIDKAFDSVTNRIMLIEAALNSITNHP